MSHFTVLVTKTQDKSVDDQLAPFDENRDVPAYDRECYCIGNIARRAADKLAKEELGWDVDSKRDDYWKLPDDERTDERWKATIKPFVYLSKKYEQAHELYGKSNPDCEECHGTGTDKSQYNPDSKWDWYSIGGRWTGYFKLKDGTEGALGESGVFGNEPENDADVARVKDIDWERMEQPVATFAVLHDGEWHERGDMGWWGMVTDEKDADDWNKQFDALVASLNPDDEVTIVDCHI